MVCSRRRKKEEKGGRRENVLRVTCSSCARVYIYLNSRPLRFATRSLEDTSRFVYPGYLRYRLPEIPPPFRVCLTSKPFRSSLSAPSRVTSRIDGSMGVAAALGINFFPLPPEFYQRSIKKFTRPIVNWGIGGKIDFEFC